MCQPVGTQTNLEEDVDTVKAATGPNNQKNTVQPTVSRTQLRRKKLQVINTLANTSNLAPSK